MKGENTNEVIAKQDNLQKHVKATELLKSSLLGILTG